MGIYADQQAGAGAIAWPSPIKSKMTAPLLANLNNCLTIPDIATNDGSVWSIDGSSITRLGPTGSVVWTIAAAADVNASATTLACFLIDYTDGMIYAVWISGTANSCYFVANPLTTKSVAVTPITTNFTNGLQKSFMDRPGGQGSGNLRIFSANTAGTPPTMERRDISTAGVLQGTLTTVTFASVTPSISGNTPTYMTLAQTLLADFFIDTTVHGITAAIRLSRNGSFGMISTNATTRPIIGASSADLKPILNGPYVTLHSNVADAKTGFVKTMLRSDFDAFLNVLADSVGCL